MRTLSLTAIALVAFAANSVLCRVALRDGLIDPATFLTLRVAAGAAMLLAVAGSARLPRAGGGGSWWPAILLVLYGIPFSFAYLELSAGTGALILFGAVQVTMVSAAIASGERPHVVQWIGLALACGGLVYLVLPGLAAPPFADAALMGLAGTAWGLYSLRGRGAVEPLVQNTTNFVRAVPLVLAVNALAWPQFQITRQGALLAALSGAVASGLGYVVWYMALRGLSAARAAVVQLAVPVIAAAGGVIILSEEVSLRLVVAAALVLGGIALALGGSSRRRSRQERDS